MCRKILFKGISIFTILLILISSCKTSNDVASNRLIQKRKYTKGFYVNNHNNPKTKKDKILIEDTNTPTEDLLVENTIDTQSKKGVIEKVGKNKRAEKPNDMLVVSSDEGISESVVMEKKELTKWDYRVTPTKNNKYKKVKYDNPPTTKKIEPLGLWGFITEALGFGMLLLFLAMAWSFATAAAFYFVFALAILILAGLILSIISLIKFEQEPDKYKGIFLPITALVLFAVLIVIILTASL